MKHLVLAILLLSFGSLHAQLLKGKVIDQEGKPIENANIQHPRTGLHGHSNPLGYFSLSLVVPGDSVLVSHIGYKTLATKVTNLQEVYEIRLSREDYKLEQIVITSDAQVFNTITKLDMNLNPVKSSQEILRKVPGLFIGQHAGGGKAEQIFLRGFDIDHGTDIALTADGLPVNMVSHAHGQGYADLHFLIPETIENIEFGKGPYSASKGNFSTAGYVDFHTYDRLNNAGLLAMEYGMFNSLRTVGMFNLMEGAPNQDAYAAIEYSATDGPFDAPQNFSRINLLTKYSGTINDRNHLKIQVSAFRSEWDASGQVPLRAVESGSISHFGAIDDTEGGSTSRSNLSLIHTHWLTEQTSLKSQIFYSKYQFELFSNFTFFLVDSVNGDQIRQKEDREIMGFNSTFNKQFLQGQWDINLNAGLGFRNDQITDNELSRSKNRQHTLENIALGDVNETNLFAFGELEIHRGKWLINPGIRMEYFNFQYYNKLDSNYQTLAKQSALPAPKLNISYAPGQAWQLYLKSGISFHSNDTRVIASGSGLQKLPPAYGLDLGSIWKLGDQLIFNAALWYLYMEQEFVYVGDGGVVEPSGRTARKGIDFGLRVELTPWLFLDADANFAHARAIDEPQGQNYIPLAPIFTSAGGLSVQPIKGVSANLRYRYLHDRPANEDNSTVAKGYFISDANINYQYKKWLWGISAENLFNTQWYETQFDTESRLRGEAEPTSEIHYTPGTPFFVKLKASILF